MPGSYETYNKLHAGLTTERKKIMRMWTKIISVCFLVITGFQPLFAEEKPKADFRWVGCGITKKAFMQELAKAYEHKTGLKFQIDGGGATKGIRNVATLEADMGGACRYTLTNIPEEAGVKMFPVAWDALVVITHKDNPVTNITVDQIRGIYRGEVTNWKELGGNNAPIELMVRKGKISGVGLTLRQLVFFDEDMDFVSDNVFPSSGPLEKAVVAQENAIGITGISSARKRDVKLLTLEGKAPNYDNIRSGDYLLYRPLYIVANSQSPKYSEVKKFVDFAASRKGREIIKNNGVVPYLEATQLIVKQYSQWRVAAGKKGAAQKPATQKSATPAVLPREELQSYSESISPPPE